MNLLQIIVPVVTGDNGGMNADTAKALIGCFLITHFIWLSVGVVRFFTLKEGWRIAFLGSCASWLETISLLIMVVDGILLLVWLGYLLGNWLF